MDNFDLDLNNYSIDDILQLFKIDGHNILFDDLKRAKQIALKMHPDKSKLPPKYFHFFSGALKLLVQIYSFKNRSNDLRDHYSNDDEDIDVDLLNFSLISKTNKKEFSKKFNELFDKSYIKSEMETHGYGELFKSDFELSNETFNEKKKRMTSDMIVYETPKILAKSYNHLTQEKLDDYSSDLYSNLKYEDLKKSQEEAIIPIDDSYIKHIKVFKNIQEIKTHRERQNITPYSDSENILLQQNNHEDESSMQRARFLINKDQLINKQKAYALSQFKQLDWSKN